MSSRLTRQDIKRDEVMETLGGFFGFVTHHARTIALAAVGLVVLGLGYAVYRGVAASREERAGRALGRALAVHGAPILETGADPSNEESPSFADEVSRVERATALFTELVEEYGRTASADIARAYLGSLASAAGDLETAREHWERFVKRQRGNVLAAEVRLNLMALDRSPGRGEEVVDELRAELAGRRSDLPEEVLLNELARTLEQLERTDEAVAIYERLVEDHPLSPYARSAARRISELEAATSG